MNTRRLKSIIFMSVLGSAPALVAYVRHNAPVEPLPKRSYLLLPAEDKKYGFSVETGMYARATSEAFTEGWSETENLASLVFGRSSFRLVEAMPNSEADYTFSDFNPLIKTVEFEPEISYYEKGMVVKGEFAYKVNIAETEGSVGLRAYATFKRIEVEREDSGDKKTDQVSEVFTGAPQRDGKPETPFIYAARLDFAKSVVFAKFDAGLNKVIHKPAVELTTDSSGQWTVMTTGFAYTPSAPACRVALFPRGTVPTWRDGDFLFDAAVPNTGVTNYPTYDPRGSSEYQKLYKFPTSSELAASQELLNSYKWVFEVDNNISPLDRTEILDKQAEIWLGTVFQSGSNSGSPYQQSQQLFYNVLMPWYTVLQGGENAYIWLWKHGYEFETDYKKGIGDAKVEAFYRHYIAQDFAVEGTLGLVLPFGSTEYYGNPYTPSLGNGGHAAAEISLSADWRPGVWGVFRAKLLGGYAFRSKENIPAAFAGATVKGVGPTVAAEISWSYMQLDLDVNLVHPRTDGVSFLIGYNMYWKSEDDISFPRIDARSWLGKKDDGTTLQEYTYNLDSDLAAKYTDSIAHRFRFELSLRLSNYFEAFIGGITTAFGRSVARDSELYTGFTVAM